MPASCPAAGGSVKRRPRERRWRRSNLPPTWPATGPRPLAKRRSRPYAHEANIVGPEPGRGAHRSLRRPTAHARPAAGSGLQPSLAPPFGGHLRHVAVVWPRRRRGAGSRPVPAPLATLGELPARRLAASEPGSIPTSTRPTFT